jgi:serine/threonine protein kinase
MSPTDATSEREHLRMPDASAVRGDGATGIAATDGIGLKYGLAWASAAMPRDAVPGYTLEREISRGGQGVVYLAVQQSTGLRVAVKVMREGPFAGPQDRARFERAARVLDALDHPNVVTVIDRGATPGGSAYFVMAYVDGQTLDVWRAVRPAAAAGDGADAGRLGDDPAEVLRLFVRICDAVNAAHLRGIVHRDLKPSNILVTPDGEPHVVDFGLAHPGFVEGGGGEAGAGPGPLTITGQFLGSLPWASPEQAEGAASRIDTRSDVYSLGVILYQLLTGGRFPYEVAGNMRDVLNNILTAAPAPPSRVMAARQVLEMRAARRKWRQRLAGRPRRDPPIDPRLEAIVLRSLSKRRGDRYQTAGEFGRDVANYSAGLPTVASLPRPSGSRRWRISAAVVAALLGGAAVAVWIAITPAAAQPAPPGTSPRPAVPAVTPTMVYVEAVERPVAFRAWVADRTLHVAGTPGDDALRIHDEGSRFPNFPFEEAVRPVVSFDAATFDRILIDLGEGADELKLEGTASRPVDVRCGDGDNTIYLTPDRHATPRPARGSDPRARRAWHEPGHIVRPDAAGRANLPRPNREC